MARPAPPPIDVSQVAAAEAQRWQWLIDAHAHLDDCIDELKAEMKNFAVWKKSIEADGIKQAAQVAVWKWQLRSILAGVGVGGSVVYILHLLQVI